MSFKLYKHVAVWSKVSLNAASDWMKAVNVSGHKRLWWLPRLWSTSQHLFLSHRDSSRGSKHVTFHDGKKNLQFLLWFLTLNLWMTGSIIIFWTCHILFYIIYNFRIIKIMFGQKIHLSKCNLSKVNVFLLKASSKQPKLIYFFFQCYFNILCCIVLFWINVYICSVCSVAELRSWVVERN